MNPKTIEVQTEELGVVTVKKLYIGDYIRAVKVLTSLWPKFRARFPEDANIEGIGREDFLMMLPDLLEEAEPEVLGVVAICTDKNLEEIRKLDLAETLDVIDAVLELNPYQKISSNVKKLVGRIRSQQPGPASEPTQKNG